MFEIYMYLCMYVCVSVCTWFTFALNVRECRGAGLCWSLLRVRSARNVPSADTIKSGIEISRKENKK